MIAKVLDDFETLIVSLENYVRNSSGVYQGFVEVKNGYAVGQVTPVTVEVLSSYTQKGGWQMLNVKVDGHECIASAPDYNGFARVLVQNRNHCSCEQA
jgi:hypothetical protein